MLHKPFSDKLRSFPVQFIENESGIILKRGRTEIRFQDRRLRDVLRFVLSSTAYNAISFEELLNRVPHHNQKIVEHIIQKLIEVNFIRTAVHLNSTGNVQESHLDVFFWEFGETNAAQEAISLNKYSITILGVNFISRQLISSLTATGIDNFQLVDEPLLRNVRLYNDAGQLRADLWGANLKQPLEFREWWEQPSKYTFDCLLVTSDFGGQRNLREWNKICIRQNRKFFPITLENMIGYIGPFVIPNETACYECLFSRFNSHRSEDDRKLRATETEAMAFNGQIAVGFFPSMASILGDMAALELTKFYSKALPAPEGNNLIEVDMMANQLLTRKVLKIPRCPVCSNMNIHSAQSIEKVSLLASTTSD